MGHLADAASKPEILAVIVAAVISLCGWLVRVLFVRAQLKWAVCHEHAFFIQDPTSGRQLYTREIWVQNSGRATAEGVEVIFAYPPQRYEIWPSRQYHQNENPDGTVVLQISNLSPREYFTISMIQANSPPPLVTNVRWRGGIGVKVQMGPQQIFPVWWNRVIRLFLFFSLFSIGYFVLRIVLWLHS